MCSHRAAWCGRNRASTGRPCAWRSQLLVLIATPDVGGASTHRAGLQVGETEPFIAELLGELTTTIQDLETHQIHMFYEAVGLMISADADNRRRDEYLVRFGSPLLI